MHFKPFAAIALGASLLVSAPAWSAASIEKIYSPTTFSLTPQITDLWYEYSADEAVNAQVSIKNKAEGWQSYFESNKTIEAGEGLVEESIWISSQPPVGNEYVYEVKLFSKATGELLDYKTADVARIRSGLSPINRLIAVDAPSVYNPLEEAQIEVFYESAQPVDIKIALKNPEQNWAWYGESSFDGAVASNSQIYTNFFTPSVFPEAGTGYVWEVKLYHPETGERIGRLIKPVEIVVNEGEISSLVADSDTLVAGETRTITVDYFAPVEADLRIDIILDNDEWAGSNTIPVAAGHGTADIAMQIPEVVNAHAFAKLYVKVLPRGAKWYEFYDESFVVNYVPNTVDVPQYWNVPLLIEGYYSTGRPSPSASSTDINIAVSRLKPLKQRFVLDVAVGSQYGDEGHTLDLASGNIYVYTIDYTLPEDHKEHLVHSIVKPGDKAAYKAALEAMRERVDFVRVTPTLRNPKGLPELATLLTYIDGVLAQL